MKRLPDWQLRLEAFTRERASMPFAWGTNDCATFAAACVEAMTGVRPLPELRGYSALQAVRLIEERGGLRGIATEVLGEPIPAAFAAVGDVVLVRMGKADALGICNGSCAMGPGEAGIEMAAMGAVMAAWRV